VLFILGLDGLDSDLVDKWGLTNLKQHQHGKITVPIDPDMNVPSTPTVWYQFLTGVEHNAKHRQMPWSWHLLRKIKDFAKKFGVHLSFGLSNRIKTLHFPPLQHETFLDHVNSVKINVPYYNFNSKDVDPILQGLNDKTVTLCTAKYLVHNVYERKKHRLFKRLETLEVVDIVFAYLHFPDTVQHLSYPEPNQVRRHYENLNETVLELKKELPPNTTFLIMSDHGFSFIEKTHSKYGFYSCNKPLTPEPKRITDFFNIIRRMNYN